MTVLSNSIMQAAIFHGHERITIERMACRRLLAAR
jgi:hypothetical protein